MTKTWTVIVATLFIVAPLALAHEPSGTPKNYCETGAEWAVHEYGPPATGALIHGQEDGNLGGDCNGDGILADLDGHAEFALGGANILAESGDGATHGSILCFGDEAHHDYFGPSTVEDLVLGAGSSYTVSADTVDLTGNGNGCGDNLADQGTDCVGGCTVTFPPGLDGSYQVYVQGSQGHLSWSGGGGNGGGAGRHVACSDGLDNDADGWIDTIDPDCSGPEDLTEACAPDCVDLNDPDPIGEPDPDLVDPSTNAPPPPAGLGAPSPESDSSTSSCGSIHIHGTKKKSWYHGSYFDGPVWAHFHTCSGTQNQGNGVTWHTTGASIYKNWAAYPNQAQVWWGDGKYHNTCISFQQNDGTWVGGTYPSGGCWKMRN